MSRNNQVFNPILPSNAYIADGESDEKRPYMYAPDVVQGNDGKFYLYYCLAGWKGTGGYFGPISVAVCDKPNGKYEYLGYVKNPDGTPFSNYVTFDPAVINDGGVIRLYYGTSMPKGMSAVGLTGRLMAPFIKGIYGKGINDFHQSPGPLGANVVELTNDMLTVKGSAKRILPEKAKGTAYEGHAFFEASSIRKVGMYYYFIYSSEKNHELCYAISRFPDRDFSFGGTIISNGDVGYQGRKESDRLNATGTTHGSMECINGQWYVFYHRLTHGSDYSRQACAEPIKIEADGRIAQVPVSSCGLNSGPLLADGNYAALIACILSNGNMPHISNRVWQKLIPKVTHDERDRFITNINRNTCIGYKYFTFDGAKGQIAVSIRGKGSGDLILYVDEKRQEKIAVFNISVDDSKNWCKYFSQFQIEKGTYPIYFLYLGKGLIDFLDFSFFF